MVISRNVCNDVMLLYLLIQIQITYNTFSLRQTHEIYAESPKYIYCQKASRCIIRSTWVTSWAILIALSLVATLVPFRNYRMLLDCLSSESAGQFSCFYYQPLERLYYMISRAKECPVIIILNNATFLLVVLIPAAAKKRLRIKINTGGRC